MKRKKVDKKLLKIFTKILRRNSLYNRDSGFFLSSERKMSTKIGESRYIVGKLMKELHSRDLTRFVKHLDGKTYLMIDPMFFGKKSQKNFWFNKAMFHLKSYEKVIKWIDNCWKVGYLIDPETGVVYFEDEKEKYNKIHRVQRKMWRCVPDNFLWIFDPQRQRDNSIAFVRLDPAPNYRYDDSVRERRASNV